MRVGNRRVLEPDGDLLPDGVSVCDQCLEANERLFADVGEGLEKYVSDGPDEDPDLVESYMKEFMRKLVMGIADATMEVDGRVIYEASDLRVGLFTSTENF